MNMSLASVVLDIEDIVIGMWPPRQRSRNQSSQLLIGYAKIMFPIWMPWPWEPSSTAWVRIEGLSSFKHNGAAA